MARTGDCGSPDVGSTPMHRTILLLRRGWQAIRSGVIGSANCREVLQGVRLAVSRQSLKLASGVRLAHPLPIGRWRNLAARCALNAEVSGSIPERPSKLLCARSLIGQALHYECSRWRFESSRAYQDYRPSSNWTGRGAPNAEIPVRPRMAGPSFMGASGSDAEVM